VTTLTLVLTAVGSVLLLLFLVMKARMHAFLALMVVSIGAGLFSGMPLIKIAETMEKGMGGTLGFLSQAASGLRFVPRAQFPFAECSS